MCILLFIPKDDLVAAFIPVAVDYIHRLMNQKNELKTRVRDLQAHLGDPLEDMDSVSATIN